MEEMKSKRVTSAKVTIYEPDLSWNKWKDQPKDNTPGVPLPDDDKVKVEITWPDLETFERLIGNDSTFATFITLTKHCATKITGFSLHGEPIETGAELAAVRAGRTSKARELAINIGSYIFKESLLDEEEEKN